MWFRVEANEVERRFLLFWLVDGEGDAEKIHCGHDGIAQWQYGSKTICQNGKMAYQSWVR